MTMSIPFIFRALLGINGLKEGHFNIILRIIYIRVLSDVACLVHASHYPNPMHFADQGIRAKMHVIWICTCAHQTCIV